MILRRLGNKRKIANNIIPHFPAHKIYIEPFFGAGGMFFNKPKAKYSIVNDLDSDVFNLFQVIKDSKDDFLNLFRITPMSEELFNYWLKNKETEPLHKALRFLFLSSFSFLGKNDTFMLLHSNCNYKQKLEILINESANYFKNTLFRNKDFRVFFDSIYETEKHIPKSQRFIYSDSPYVETTDNYGTPKWTKTDCIDLLDTLVNTDIRFAMSEFNHEFVLDESKKRGLNIIEIGERKNINNRRIEILITNYENTQRSLFA